MIHQGAGVAGCTQCAALEVHAVPSSSHGVQRRGGIAGRASSVAAYTDRDHYFNGLRGMFRSAAAPVVEHHGGTAGRGRSREGLSSSHIRAWFVRFESGAPIARREARGAGPTPVRPDAVPRATLRPGRQAIKGGMDVTSDHQGQNAAWCGFPAVKAARGCWGRGCMPGAGATHWAMNTRKHVFNPLKSTAAVQRTLS